VTGTVAPLGGGRKLRFGMRLPDCGHQCPLLIGLDRGYYRDEGVEPEIVVTERLAEGLLAGQLEVADLPSTEVVLLAAEAAAGPPLRLVAGWHARRDYFIAVRPEIGSVRDLAGKRVILGAAADAGVRRRLLSDAGWDLDAVEVETANPPGGSDVWMGQLMSGEAALAPIFLRHFAAAERAGIRLVVDVSRDWPSNSLAVTAAFLAAEPEVLTAFLRATLRAMRVWMDPANRDDCLGLCERRGLRVSHEARATYERGFLRPYARASLALREEEFADLVRSTGLLPEPPPFAAYADLGPLHAAQRALGVAEA
jgi:ABC-type nitrate/sulfonate/bicarbonate transport system substrate-binding protein